MKQIICVLLLLFTLSSCKHKKAERNVSIMQNQDSLINAWYGKDHFKPGVVTKDEPLNTNPKQEAVEIDAGKIVINPSTTNVSSTANLAEAQEDSLSDEAKQTQLALEPTSSPCDLETSESQPIASKYEEEKNDSMLENDSAEIDPSISYHEMNPMEVDE